MRRITRLLFLFVALITQPVSKAHAFMLSTGLDGALNPSSSTQLTPNEDGIFNFTTIDIAEQILVSFDRSSWESEIYLLANGNINIYGALDTGLGPLHIYTPGIITIDGKLYGDTITIKSEELHAINNPNGNSDIHLYGGVDTTLQPDGQLAFFIEEPTFEISGIDISLSGINANNLPGVYNYTSSVMLYSPAVLITPLPPAIWLLLSAFGMIGFFGRNKKAQEQI